MIVDSHRQNSSLSPTKTLGMILAITFVMEMIVMLLLPLVVTSDVNLLAEAAIDSTLLTLLAAPAIWLVIIGPLHRLARAERMRAAAIIESAGDGIITTDASGKVVSFNRTAESIFGAAGEKVIGRSIAELLTSESWTAYNNELQSGQRATNGHTLELTGQTSNGPQIPLAVSISSIQRDHERTFIAVARDLTRTKQDEAELRKRARQQEVIAELGRVALASQTDELYASLVENVRDVLDVDLCGLLQLTPGEDLLFLRADAGWPRRDAQHTILEVASCRDDGFEPLSDTPVRLRYLESRPAFCESKLLVNSGATSGISVPVDGFGRRFGALMLFSKTKREFTDDEANFLLAVSTVVTTAIERERNEIRQREHAAIKADQATAVAQVATGVAHELRNPLTSIKMLVQSHLHDDDSLNDEDLGIIVEESRRMEGVLNTFLEYARPATPTKQPVDLRDVAKGIAPLINGRAGKQGVKLKLKMPDDPAMVNADAGQMRQVLMNLALNAFDVMPRGGLLQMEITCNDGHTQLSVADTGPRIRDDVWTRMFEPFFTTKETGVGLGLGVSQRIAEDHGGSLTAVRGAKAGTRFVLGIPLLQSVRQTTTHNERPR